MKITYIHQYFATPKSSGGIRSYLIAKALVEKGHKVNMLTSSAFVPADWNIAKGWNLFEVNNISVHVLHLPYSNKPGFVKRLYIFLVFMLRTLLKSFSIKADLVFATSTPLTVAIPAGLCASFKRIPFIFEVRDVWPDIPIAMGYLNNKLMQKVAVWVELWAYKKSQHIIALSDGMAKRICDKGVPANKVSVVENFSDNILFDSCGSLEQDHSLQKMANFNGKVLTYTGTFGHVNHLKYLIDLAACLQAKNLDVMFALVGDGREKKELKEYASMKKVLDKNLVFFQPVRKDQLPWVLANSDSSISTVLPVKALWDNSANKFFDALAAGLPVIINHGGWQADLINESGCGVVLDHDNVSKASEQLVSFLSDKDRFSLAKASSKKLANERFDTSLQTDKISQILEKFTY